MKLGVFTNGWWREACRALELDTVELPVAEHSSGNAYSSEVSARHATGTKIVELLASEPDADLLVDNGGAGLLFAAGPHGADDLRLAHELATRTLCSHFIDPLVTSFQGMDWPVVWQCLQSRSWIKAVWDRAQAIELQRFGVPAVVHLPMAAPDREYDTRPLDVSRCRPIVSFVGGQNTSYFSPHVHMSGDRLLAGALAHAIRSDLPGTSFYEAYHDVYRLADPVREGDDVQTQVDKTTTYMAAKLYYNAALCIRNRDRFVVYLKRQLSDTFHLVGSGWDRVYGLSTAPRFETSDDYFDHFREAAINLNLVNGNAETAPNMRLFEITAAGGFLMCYHQPEVEELFDVGRECVVFRDERDLLEKIRYFLEHPKERAEIALAGQQRTLSRHLYRHRLETLLRLTGPNSSESPHIEESVSAVGAP